MAGIFAAVLFGMALLAVAWMLGEHWLVTHFPPDFYPSYGSIYNSVQVVRALLGIVGSSAILFARRAGPKLMQAISWPRIFSTAAIIVAIVMAFGAAEFILRYRGWQTVLPRRMMSEPLRLRDPVLGWIQKPSHTGYKVTGGRRIEYAYDTFGYREPNQDAAPDFTRPTIVLAGESVMGGFGLNWNETIAAQLGRLTNIQTVDLSVGGYATDQIYLRLASQLPRFRKPAAIVILFSPMLFRRNIENGRPHLGPDLTLQPAIKRGRLVDMARWEIPYRSLRETGRAIETTRAILAGVVHLSRSRGAIPVVLVPQFQPENPAERNIRQRVLGDIGLPVVYVQLDGNWHLRRDWHPNAQAARVMAAALARYLEPRLHPRSGSMPTRNR